MRVEKTEAEETLRLPVGGGAETICCRWRPAAAADRPTILYLHGFGSSQGGEKAEFYRSRAAAEGIGFLSLDFRGHGLSDGDLLGLSLTRCLADVEAARAWLDDRVADRWVVIGSSMGGLVGLWHAARRPEGVLGALYMAPAIGLREDLRGLLGDEGIRSWRDRGEIEFENELGVFRVGWSLYRDLEDHPPARLAELHRVPSLIYQGRLDDRVSWRGAADFARRAGAAVRLELLDEGDHRLLEWRDEMWTALRAFLRAGATIGV